ncbi:hypothetical protein EV363DRAFT_889315 [Boletus edulis]|nr:hypothetical protein EV363DRAFT_889315 [Boletus edulis]
MGAPSHGRLIQLKASVKNSSRRRFKWGKRFRRLCALISTMAICRAFASVDRHVDGRTHKKNPGHRHPPASLEITLLNRFHRGWVRIYSRRDCGIAPESHWRSRSEGGRVLRLYRMTGFDGEAPVWCGRRYLTLPSVPPFALSPGFLFFFCHLFSPRNASFPFF